MENIAIASFGYFVKHCPTLITRLQQMGCKRAQSLSRFGIGEKIVGVKNKNP
ncbi:hypothetical protein ACOWMA_00085 [Helicobacter pylori]